MKPESQITTTSLQMLGELIRAGRLQQKLSQSNLATRLNVSRQTVMALEKGEGKVAIGTAFEAAHIVGVPILTLAEGQTARLKQLNQWMAMLEGFNALMPERIPGKKVELDDDF